MKLKAQNWKLAALLFAVGLYPISFCLGQSTVTVTGTLDGPGGSPATGFIALSATNPFVSADGYNVAPGPPIQISISGGTFSASLIPNAGSSTVSCAPPSTCSYYRATFNLSSPLGSTQYSQVWLVPSSGPVAYQTIVVTSVTPPALSIPFSELTPPAGCVANQFPQWTGTGWTCSASSGSGLADPGANGIIKRTALNTTAIALAADYPTLNQSTTGNAATATALASGPTQCGSNQFSTGIAASGNANCSIIGFISRDVSGTSDTVAATDHTAGIVFTGGSNATEALPTATTLGYANFWTQITNAMTGAANTVTVNATSWQIYPNGGSSGASSLTINNGQSCWIYVDAAGGAWDAICHEAQLTAGTNITFTRTAAGVSISASGSGMTWPSGSAGIANYNGSSAWGTSYNASNLIPANFVSTLNQNTTGNAATATALAATPTLCNSGYAAGGIVASGNATQCAILATSISSVSHKWMNSYTASTGVFTQTQPACGDLSDSSTGCTTTVGTAATHAATDFAASNAATTVNSATCTLGSTCAVSASNITTGTLPAGQLPNPTASTLGGVESLASASHKWLNTISTSGVPSATQPASADLSDYGSFPAAAFASQTANYFFAAPNGSSGTPAWRAIVGADIPTLNQSTTGNAATATNLASYPTLCSGSQFSQGVSSGSNNCATPSGSGGAFSAITTGTNTTATMTLGSGSTLNAASGATVDFHALSTTAGLTLFPSGAAPAPTTSNVWAFDTNDQQPVFGDGSVTRRLINGQFYYASASGNSSISASSSTGLTTPNDSLTHYYRLVGQVSMSAAGTGTCTSCLATLEVTVTFTDPNNGTPVTEVLTGGTAAAPGTLTLTNGALGTTGLIGQIEAPLIVASANTTIQAATVYAASGFGTTNPKYILYFTLEQLK